MRPVVYIDSLNGSDSSEGSLLKPVRTLAQGYSLVSDGGVMSVQPGDGASYGDLAVSRSVSVIGTPGARPRVGTLTVDDCQGTFEHLHFENLDTGITLDNEPPMGGDHIGGVSVVDCVFEDVDNPVIIDNAAYVSILRNRMVRHLSGIYLRDAEEVSIAQNVFDDGYKAVDVETVDWIDLWRNTIYAKDGAPPPAQLDQDMRVIYRTLTAANITNMVIALPGWASVDQNGQYDVAMNVVNGPSFAYGEDYIVVGSGSIVKWEGLRLEDEFAVGDVVRVMYSEAGYAATSNTVKIFGVTVSPDSRVDSNNITGNDVDNISLGVYFNQPINIRYNNFWHADVGYTGAVPTDDAGNFTGAPMYADASVGDYRLESGSPDIDAGDPGRWTDILGEMGVGLTAGGWTSIGPDTRGNVTPFGRDVDIAGAHRYVLDGYGDVGAHERNPNEGSTGSWFSDRGYDVIYQGTETGPFWTPDYAYSHSDGGPLDAGTHEVPALSGSTGGGSWTGYTGAARRGVYRSRGMTVTDGLLLVQGGRTVDTIIVHPDLSVYETGAVFVSPDGDDSNDGSETGPYRSIQAALASGARYVAVRPGYYPSFQGASGATLVGVPQSATQALASPAVARFSDGGYTGTGTYTVARSLTATNEIDIVGEYEVTPDFDLKVRGDVGADTLYLGADNGDNRAGAIVDTVNDTVTLRIGTSGADYDWLFGTTGSTYGAVNLNVSLQGDLARVTVGGSVPRRTVAMELPSLWTGPWWFFARTTETGTTVLSDLWFSGGAVSGATGVSSTHTERHGYGVIGATGMPGWTGIE